MMRSTSFCDVEVLIGDVVDSKVTALSLLFSSHITSTSTDERRMVRSTFFCDDVDKR